MVVFNDPVPVENPALQAPRYYPFGQIDQGLKRRSVSSARTGSDKQDVIMDIPAFLPPRKRYHL
jgi:hypothetical protein